MNAATVLAVAALSATPTITITTHTPAGDTVQTGTVSPLRYTGGHLSITFTPAPEAVFRNGFEAK